jgi:hypothetical protein
MKNKMTFYIEAEVQHDFQLWINKHFELTGNKLTKTDVLNMLLRALLYANESHTESAQEGK